MKWGNWIVIQYATLSILKFMDTCCNCYFNPKNTHMDVISAALTDTLFWNVGNF
jgi:hypothetical protein